MSNILSLDNYEIPSKIDMHSHILPGIDDGAKTLDDSINIILGLQNLGYEKFICTPHIMGDYYRNDSKTIGKSFNQLNEELFKRKIEAKLSFAAEYYLDESFSDKLKNNEKFLCLHSNYILVETSYINKPSNFREVIFELQMQGYHIVLAHPERYSYLYQSFDLFHELANIGVLLQLNINSLTGHYGPAAQKFGEKMIDNKLVDFVGTDCHHVRHIELLNKVKKNKFFGKLSDLNLKNDLLSL